LVLTGLSLCGRPAAAQARTGSIRGVVHDSLLASGPIPDALVEILELGREKRTDARGSFRFDSVPGGRYSVAFTHPSLNAIGLVPPERVVELGAGIDVSIVLATPSASTIHARLCRGSREANTGLLLGRLRDARTGGPLGGGEVRGEWEEAIVSTAGGIVRRGRTVRAATDAGGRFQLCGVPLDVGVLLTTTAGPARGAPLELQMGGRLVAVRDLSLAPETGPAPRSARVAGRVRGEDGSPIGNALVALLGRPGGTRTDSSGRFRLDQLPPGSFTLDVRALGFTRGRAPLELEPGREATAEVTLARLAVELPEVAVESDAALADPTGFAARRGRGVGGYFISREDVLRRGSIRTEDLLRTVPGIKIEPVGATDYQIVSLRGGAGFSPTCAPTVYIDGIRIPLDPEFGSGLPILPEEIHGIEIYQSPASAPIEFRVAGENCGIILAWTRRGGSR
jgi:hypothetical protein